MKKRYFAIFLMFMFGLLSFSAFAADCGGDTVCNCGDTLTGSRVLNSSDNLTDCLGNGLNIGADNILIDCNGSIIDGTSSTNSIGVNNTAGYDNFSMRNCEIKEFYFGLKDGNVGPGSTADQISENGTIENNNFHSLSESDYNVLLVGSGNLYYNNTFSCLFYSLFNNAHDFNKTTYVNITENKFDDILKVQESTYLSAKDNDIYSGALISGNHPAGEDNSPSYDIIFENNNFHGTGLDIKNMTNSTILDNYNMSSITVSQSGNITIDDNFLCNGDSTITLTSNSHNNTGDNVCDNVIDGDSNSVTCSCTCSPVLNYNSTTTSVDIGDDITIETNWTDGYIDSENLTCQLYVDGSLSETINSSGSWCNFTYTTTSADYGTKSFYVTAVNKIGNSDTSSTMTSTVNLACGSVITSDFTMEDDLIECGSEGLTIGANDITLDCDGHVIDSDEEGRGVPGNLNYGIGISGYNSTTIKNCLVNDFSTGIYAENGYSHTIQDNNLTDNYQIFGGECGIHFSNIFDSTISGNNASNNDIGIYFSSSSRNTIDSNTIDNNNNNNNVNGGYGIKLESSSQNNTISNNYVRQNSKVGIYLKNSNNAVIEDNVVNDNSESGIFLDNGANNNITGNTINDNSHDGIEMDGASNNYIYNNILKSNNGQSGSIPNWGGISLYSSSNNNVVDNNDFYYNRGGLRMDGINSINITNNVFFSNRYSSIYFADDDIGGTILIQGNTLKDSGQTNGGGAIDILCSYSTPDINISNNVVSGNTPVWIEFESQAECDASNIAIQDNTLDVTLTSPAEGYTLDSSVDYYNFTYDVTNFLPTNDDWGLGFTGNCTLYVDGTAKNVSSFTDKATDVFGNTKTISNVSVSYKAQTWYVSCEDDNGNTAESEHKSLTTVSAQAQADIAVTTTANTETAVNATVLSNNNITANITLMTGVATSGTITVSQYEDNPASSTSGFGTSLGVFMGFDLNMSGLDWAIIKMYYTDAQASGLDESTLRISYFNATSNTWQEYDDPYGGVNTTANYVWANTTHFSVFGASGNTPSTTTTTTTTTSGGGSIGGSLPSVKTEEGIKVSHLWSAIKPDISAIFSITNIDVAFRKVMFDVKESAVNIGMDVIALNENPEPSSEVVDPVYQYVEVDTTNLDTENIESAKISFRVKKSWLNGNKKENVVLLRFTDSKWAELPTTLTNDDSTYAYYDATTPGFSHFAIAAKKTAKEEIEIDPLEEVEKEAEDVVEEIEEEDAVSEVEPVEPEKAYGWIIVVLVLIIGVAIYYWNKK